MQHFPVFVDLRGQRVVIAGTGETALAKLRLVLRTEACITVCGADPHPLIAALADEGRLRLVERLIEPGDADGGDPGDGAGHQHDDTEDEADAGDDRAAAGGAAEGGSAG